MFVVCVGVGCSVSLCLVCNLLVVVHWCCLLVDDMCWFMLMRFDVSCAV